MRAGLGVKVIVQKPCDERPSGSRTDDRPRETWDGQPIRNEAFWDIDVSTGGGYDEVLQENQAHDVTAPPVDSCPRNHFFRKRL